VYKGVWGVSPQSPILMLELWLRPRFWSVYRNRSAKRETEGLPRNYYKCANLLFLCCLFLYVLQLHIIVLYHESKLKATMITIILWIISVKCLPGPARPAPRSTSQYTWVVIFREFWGVLQEILQQQVYQIANNGYFQRY